MRDYCYRYSDAPPEIRCRHSCAEALWPEHKPQVPCRIRGTLKGGRLFRDQRLTCSKIDSSVHPGIDPQGCPGTELPAQSSGPLAPATAELYDRCSCVGNQRRICSAGDVWK